MVDTCLVTGTIVAPDGTPVRRAFMLFQRLPEEAFVADDATALPTPVTKRTANDGSIEVELIPGAYLVKQWYGKHDYFRIDVPDEPTARLEDIQDDILQPPPSEILQAVMDAEAARDASEGYRDEAHTARAGAQAARIGAEQARDAAQAARTGAEQARDAAQAARNAAENLYGDLDAVEQAKDAAVSARIRAETARDIAEGYASDAVSQGNVPIYASVATVEGLNIPPGITAIRTNGYYSPGDGGGALYKRVASEPSHAGKIQSADGAWWELADQPVNVRMFGARGDGVTDDTAAFEAQLQFNGTVHVPVGDFVIADRIKMPASGVRCDISGEDRNKSRILWTGDDQPAPQPNLFDFSAADSAGHWFEQVNVRDLCIHGSHDVNRSQHGGYTLYVQRARRVTIRGVEVGYSRTMGLVVRGATSAIVTDSYVHHCARDGINLANCTNALVTNCVVEYVDDDCIAVHNQIYRAGRQVVVANNRCKLVQGIKVLGAQAATIVGNSIDYFWGQGVSVATLSSGLEGVNAANVITITGNVLTNAFSRELLDNRNQEAPYIRISGHSANAGSLDNIPDTKTVAPYDYFYNISSSSDDFATTPIPASGRIIVANNVFAKDMPTSGVFSDLGIGLPWLRDGEYDFSLDESEGKGNLRGPLMIVSHGVVNDLIVKGNIAMGVNAARFDAVTVENLEFEGNIVKDAHVACINLGNTSHVRGQIRGNVFDADPYYTAASRNSDGSYSAQGNPTVLLTNNANSQIGFFDNDVKNVCRIVDNNPSTLQSQGKVVFKNVRLFGQFESGGFSTSNKGIGTLPFRSLNEAFVFVSQIVDSENPSYGEITHYPVVEGSAPVDDQYYPSGWYIYNTSRTENGTAPYRYVVKGWIKQESGVGSQWLEDRAYYELVAP